METSRQNLIKQIAQKTGLRFQPEVKSGNLCFRENNQNLRDDFKEVFSTADLELYIQFFNGEEVELPVDNLDFWKKISLAKSRLSDSKPF